MIGKFKLKKKQKNKKKKGFTLVELLAVIVILAVIMVITIPTVLGSIGETKSSALESSAKAIKQYLKNNYDKCKLGNELVFPYDKEIFDQDCQLKYNISDKLITNSGYSTKDIKKVSVTTDEKGSFEIKVNATKTGNFSGANSYLTGFYNNVNEPDLTTGLIPVIFDEESKKWVVADITKQWYNYSSDEQWWANAVSVLSGTRDKYVNSDKSFKSGTVVSLNDLYAMFVWIPRFSYTIGCIDVDSDGEHENCLGYQLDGASPLSVNTPGAIDIKFISKDDIEDKLTTEGIYPQYTYTSELDRLPTNWHTHPAFWNDKNNNNLWESDENHSGIWVGKFETSGSTTTPYIKPNNQTLVKNKISTMFEISKKFITNASYKISGDSHMAKNSEWSAVAYLSQSVFGKYGNTMYKNEYKEVFVNNSSNYYAGKSSGTYNPSTTSSSGSCSYDDIKDRGNGVGACGAGASTTGNVYGVYDMSGGAKEYVMGYYYSESGVTNDGGPWGRADLSNYAGFSTKPLNKYINEYFNNNIFSIGNNIIGHSTAEVNGWYGDYNDNLNYNTPWIARGGFPSNGNKSGIFALSKVYGSSNNSISFRVVLTKN